MSVGAGSAEASDKDLVCVMLAVSAVGFRVGFAYEGWVIAEVGRLIRRLLTSPSGVTTLEPFFTPDFDNKDAVGLFPKLLNNALNFLFEVFIIASFKTNV